MVSRRHPNQRPDKALSDAWDAMPRAHRLAVAQPSLRNMARAVRAWEAFAALAGYPQLLDDEAQA